VVGGSVGQSPTLPFRFDSGAWGWAGAITLRAMFVFQKRDMGTRQERRDPQLLPFRREDNVDGGLDFDRRVVEQVRSVGPLPDSIQRGLL
jgi:hypothetical protein